MSPLYREGGQPVPPAAIVVNRRRHAGARPTNPKRIGPADAAEYPLACGKIKAAMRACVALPLPYLANLPPAERCTDHPPAAQNRM